MKLWCFGDSNTYGYDPCGFFGGRYAAPWPALLAEKTGFQVINDGKNGRMIPEREHEFLQFRRDAERHSADALIVMLGTNDLKEQYHVTTWVLARAMEQLMHIIDAYEYAPHYQKPQVLLVSPIEVGEDIENSPFGCFTRAAIAPSKEFAKIYAPVAEKYGAHFFDAASVARPSAEDQLHMDESSHRALADALAVKVREVLA